LLEVYEIAPAVTRERMYIQAVEQVLANSSKIFIDTESSGNMMYLPLDRLMQGTGGSSSSSRSSGSSNQADIGMLTDQVLQELRSRQDTNIRRSR
jgi:membrane protease subunit HflK